MPCPYCGCQDIPKASGVNAVAVTPDGHFTVTASDDHTLELWDLTPGKCLLTLKGDTGFETCAITPDGRTIVAGDEAGAVHFIEWVRGKEVVSAQ